MGLQMEYIIRQNRNQTGTNLKERELMCIDAFLKGAIRDDLLDQSEFRNWKSIYFYFIESKMSSSRSCTMILTASKEGKGN